MASKRGQGPNYPFFLSFQLKSSEPTTPVTASIPQLLSGLKSRTSHHSPLSQAFYKHDWLDSFKQLTKHFLPHNGSAQKSQMVCMLPPTDLNKEQPHVHQHRPEQGSKAPPPPALSCLPCMLWAPDHEAVRDHDDVYLNPGKSFGTCWLFSAKFN